MIKDSRLLCLCNAPLKAAKTYSPVYWAVLLFAGAVWFMTAPKLVWAEEAVRPEIGKPLQAAQQHLQGWPTQAPTTQALADSRERALAAGAKN